MGFFLSSEKRSERRAPGRRRAPLGGALGLIPGGSLLGRTRAGKNFGGGAVGHLLAQKQPMSGTGNKLSVAHSYGVPTLRAQPRPGFPGRRVPDTGHPASLASDAGRRRSDVAGDHGTGRRRPARKLRREEWRRLQEEASQLLVALELAQAQWEEAWFRWSKAEVRLARLAKEIHEGRRR